MEKSGMNRAVMAAIGALSGFSQTIRDTFDITITEGYEPPAINSNHSMERPNRLSQKGRRKRAKWIR